MYDTRLFRLYGPDEPTDKDGYPLPWSDVRAVDPDIDVGISLGTPFGIKHIVRELAGNRCLRCGHPYLVGAEGGRGKWTRCDEKCVHGWPIEVWAAGNLIVLDTDEQVTADDVQRHISGGHGVFAKWRILTVHHLNEVKRDCRWWNLASLCQRCHLTIQGKVKMERPWSKPHTEWFRPYVAGFYAAKYLGAYLTREQVEARMDELLDLELRQLPLFGGGS